MEKTVLVEKLYEYYEIKKVKKYDVTEEGIVESERYVRRKLSGEEVQQKGYGEFGYRYNINGLDKELLMPGFRFSLAGEKYTVVDVVSKIKTGDVIYTDNPDEVIGDTYNYVLTDKTETEAIFENSTNELMEALLELTEEIEEEQEKDSLSYQM